MAVKRFTYAAALRTKPVGKTFVEQIKKKTYNYVLDT